MTRPARAPSHRPRRAPGAPPPGGRGDGRGAHGARRVRGWPDHRGDRAPPARNASSPIVIESSAGPLPMGPCPMRIRSRRPSASGPTTISPPGPGTAPPRLCTPSWTSAPTSSRRRLLLSCRPHLGGAAPPRLPALSWLRGRPGRQESAAPGLRPALDCRPTAPGGRPAPAPSAPGRHPRAPACRPQTDAELSPKGCTPRADIRTARRHRRGRADCEPFAIEVFRQRVAGRLPCPPVVGHVPHGCLSDPSGRMLGRRRDAPRMPTGSPGGGEWDAIRLRPSKRSGSARRAVTADERRARARIAAFSLHAKYDSRDVTRAARAAFLARFESEVDPLSTLPVAERQRRAEAAKKAYFLRLARKSAALRAKPVGPGRARGKDAHRDGVET